MHHLAALAGTGSHFLCSTCNCYHRASYGRTDFEKWVSRDKDKLRQYAEQWRGVPMMAEHERLFKTYGIWYSELWWLPYWDPMCQLVVNSMHCILEGLVQHHVRNLLGLTSDNSSPPEVKPPTFHHNFDPLDPETAAALSMTTKEIAQVSAIHLLLVTQVPCADNPDHVPMFMDSLQWSLLGKNMVALQYVCCALSCIPSKTTRLYKIDYANVLMQWVSNFL